MFTVASIALLTLASSAFADPSPLTPPTANTGAPCVITWSPDTTGKWTDTNIELMTGQNQMMEHVTTIVTGLDTTSAAATTYTWTCPDVTVNAAIYWYQFSHAEEPSNLIWTTRFAIASSTGATTQPAHATQPDGTAVPWGEGALVDMSLAKPAPAYVTGETTVGAGNGTASTSGSMTMSMPGSTSSALPSSSSVPKSSMVSTIIVSSTSSAAPTTTTASKNGAERATSHGAAFALGAVALGALLFA